MKRYPYLSGLLLTLLFICASCSSLTLNLKHRSPATEQSENTQAILTTVQANRRGISPWHATFLNRGLAENGCVECLFVLCQKLTSKLFSKALSSQGQSVATRKGACSILVRPILHSRSPPNLADQKTRPVL